MHELFTVNNVIALLTLTLLEIVLGIDNVVFLAILSGKLPKEQQPKARRVGLLLAMGMRILLILAIGWIMSLREPLFSFPAFWTGVAELRHGVSGRDLIMIIGGLFLIGKATYEIHDKLEGEDHTADTISIPASFHLVIVQIVLIDLVFSLDSVITAIGMVSNPDDGHGAHAVATGRPMWIAVTIMITAVMVSIAVMLAFAGAISAFVERHPTVKMLALSFLILIGVVLLVEGLHFEIVQTDPQRQPPGYVVTHIEIPKGYIYFAMAFSLVVELLNMWLRKVSKPVTLHQSYVPSGPNDPSGYRTVAGELQK